MSYLLSLALALELTALALHQSLLSVLSAACFAGFFAVHWRSLMPYPKKLALVTVAVVGVWISLGEASWDKALALASAVAYYSAFVGALGLMHCLVVHLPKLSELHQKLLAWPSASLYPAYLLSSFAISAVISFGMLSLICGSLETYTRTRNIQGRRLAAGMRGVMVSSLRGWALVPLLAPTSVGVAILTREIPSLSWSTLLPYSAVAALVMLIIGWLSENRRLAVLKSRRHEPNPTLEGISFNRLLLASAVVIAFISLLATHSSLSATQAAMVLIPLTVVGALLGLTGSLRQSLKEINQTLCGMRNESFIFGVSALLGGIIAMLVPTDWLAALIGTNPWALLAFSSLAMLSIVLGTLLGVTPIIGINLCAGVLAQMSVQGVAPLGPAIALLAGFALAMLISPYGASAIMIARYAGLTPWHVAVNWNGRFVLWALPFMLLIPLLAYL